MTSLAAFVQRSPAKGIAGQHPCEHECQYRLTYEDSVLALSFKDLAVTLFAVWCTFGLMKTRYACHGQIKTLRREKKVPTCVDCTRSAEYYTGQTMLICPTCEFEERFCQIR